MLTVSSVLTPPANGKASFGVTVEKPKEIKTGQEVKITVSVTVGQPSSKRSRMRRQTNTDCSVTMAVDGKQVYQNTLSASGGPVDLSGSLVPATDSPSVVVTQECGNEPVALTVNSVALTANANAAATKTESAGGSSETGSSGSGKGESGGSSTSSAAGSKSTDKDNLSSNNKPAACLAGLAAVVVALAI